MLNRTGIEPSINRCEIEIKEFMLQHKHKPTPVPCDLCVGVPMSHLLNIYYIDTGSFSKVVLSQGAVSKVFLGLFH